MDDLDSKHVEANTAKRAKTSVTVLQSVTTFEKAKDQPILYLSVFTAVANGKKLLPGTVGKVCMTVKLNVS